MHSNDFHMTSESDETKLSINVDRFLSGFTDAETFRTQMVEFK